MRLLLIKPDFLSCYLDLFLKHNLLYLLMRNFKLKGYSGWTVKVVSQGASWGLTRKCTDSITCILFINAFSEMNCNNSYLFMAKKEEITHHRLNRIFLPSFFITFATRKFFFVFEDICNVIELNAFPEMNSTNSCLFIHCKGKK